MATHDLRSRVKESAARPSTGDNLPRMPKVLPSTKGMSAGPHEGGERATPRGDFHHTGGSGGIRAVGGVAAYGRVEEGDDEQEQEMAVDGSPSGEVCWSAPRSGVFTRDVEEVEDEDDDALATPPALHPEAPVSSGEDYRVLQEEIRHLREQCERSAQEFESARGLWLASRVKAPGISRPRGGMDAGDEVPGVGELSSSVASCSGQSQHTRVTPAAARRLPVDQVEERRAPSENIVRETDPARGYAIFPLKKKMIGEVNASGPNRGRVDKDFRDWQTRAAAARSDNRRARAEHGIETDDDFMEPEGRDWDTWQDWTARGGSYTEERGPAGVHQISKARGLVKMALGGHAERDTYREEQRGRRERSKQCKDSSPVLKETGQC